MGVPARRDGVPIDPGLLRPLCGSECRLGCPELRARTRLGMEPNTTGMDVMPRVRRSWIAVAWGVLLLVAGVTGFPRAGAAVSTALPETALVSGLAVGAATQNFRHLSLFEALDQIRQGGVQVVEIHFGQPLTPADRVAVASTNAASGVPRVAVVNDGMLDEQIAELRRKVASSGAKLVAARVRFNNNQSANQRLFEWAVRLEIQVLVGDVPDEQFDHVERLIRKYNVAVGLWTGPRTFGGGRGSWTQPKTILTALRGRDPRFGVVVNVPNLVRAGVDPFQAMQELRIRMLGVQLTDLRPLGPAAKPAPFGQGDFDFGRLLSLLDTLRFGGYVVFEWPAEAVEFRDDLAQGLRFVRSEMTHIRRSNLLRLAARDVGTRAGLRYEVLSQGEVSEPVAVQTLPDGGVFVAGRRGDIWSWRPGEREVRAVGRVPVHVSGQRGVLGLALDPGFATNGHLYLIRSPMLAVGHSNRVSRYTATREGTNGGWQLPLESERVLLEFPGSSHGMTQGGGFLLHPRDGCLYIGTGDDHRPEETPRHYDDARFCSQDPADLRGKILRIRTDGSVPPDNPFVGRADARPEVYALGLRNPFTLSVDADTGTVYIGDVGYNRREDWEEINVLRAGANYGWPRCDGRNRDTLAATPCPLADAVAPWFGYTHDSASAVLVGPFVSKGPLPGWPDTCTHGLIYADFSRRSLRFAQVDPVLHMVTNTVSLASGLSGGPVGMALGPDGQLFLAEYAGWLAGHPQDRLSRIVPASRPTGEGRGRPTGSGVTPPPPAKDADKVLVK